MSNNNLNKNKLLPIKDISKSLLKITWTNNCIINPNLSHLHNCKDIKYTYQNTCSNIKNNNIKKSLEIKDNKLNMRIRNILDNMNKERNDNKLESCNIINLLDSNKYLDNSNNKIINYSKKINKKQALDELLLNIDLQQRQFLNNSSLFNYYSDKTQKIPETYQRIRKSIFYPSPLNPTSTLKIPPQLPIIKKN